MGNEGEKAKFKNIRMIDSTYFAVVNFVKKKDDFGIYQWVEITEPIIDDQWEAIYLKDKKSSNVITIVLIASPFLAYGAFLLGALIAFSLGGV